MQPSQCGGDGLSSPRSGLGTCCEKEVPAAPLPCFGEPCVSCSWSWGLVGSIFHLGSFETVRVDSVRIADAPSEKL